MYLEAIVTSSRYKAIACSRLQSYGHLQHTVKWRISVIVCLGRWSCTIDSLSTLFISIIRSHGVRLWERVDWKSNSSSGSSAKTNRSVLSMVADDDERLIPCPNPAIRNSVSIYWEVVIWYACLFWKVPHGRLRRGRLFLANAPTCWARGHIRPITENLQTTAYLTRR